MPNAARTGDLHVCPKSEPGPVPHVGGPIGMPPARTVYTGMSPAAAVGDPCPCAGDPAAAASPDTIKAGSSSVFIQGAAAARLGDPTEHGGFIAVGFPTVFIGG